MEEDYSFYRACHDARDDAHYLNIARTQAEILKEAERYRCMERENNR